jgi:hypothetical protein
MANRILRKKLKKQSYPTAFFCEWQFNTSITALGNRFNISFSLDEQCKEENN